MLAAKICQSKEPLTQKTKRLHLVMFDMSKAFESIKRNVLLEHLQNTIESDELYIMKNMLVYPCRSSPILVHLKETVQVPTASPTTWENLWKHQLQMQISMTIITTVHQMQVKKCQMKSLSPITQQKHKSNT